jgi:C-terminal processing protease CtpA/Prc
VLPAKIELHCTITLHTISATISEITVEGSRRWMFVDVFEDGPAYVAGIRPGDLLLATDDTETTSGNLPTFGIGPHTQTRRLPRSSV